MASTTFNAMYDSIRVATGNDDLDIGAIVLPNGRLDVLLKSTIATLRSFSESLPDLEWAVDPNEATGFIVHVANGDPTLALNTHVQQALIYAVAARYWTGIGNRLGLDTAMSGVAQEVELYVGYASTEVNEFRIDSYNQLLVQNMNANRFSF